MDALPIDPHLPALVAAMREHRGLVLVAEPGAGKTTRLPRALLDAGVGDAGEILVLEPRRIAARMAATRVAHELGEAPGQRIGYQVRFEERASASTRVRFVTEGVLTRRLIGDPRLTGVAAVVLDEFHERHLQGDLALALLRRLRATARPELLLCVMSATLDAGPVGRFLEAPVVEVPGRRYEVAIEHDPKPDERRLEQRVSVALRRLLRERLDGDVLVFLPGAAEIRRAREELAPIAEREGLELHVLHGDLPAKEQDRAVARGSRRKVILSTNLAESSLTIEGVAAVIDSGLARRAGHSPFSGLPTLETTPISRASAEQRAGRAGRLRAGRCLRLYTRADHDGRPLHDKPEIARADLCETLLAVHAIAGAGGGLREQDWYEAPPADGLRSGEDLLGLLGAIDCDGAISARGREMLRLPLHPRLARLALEAIARGVGHSGATLAALLSERDIVLSARARFDRGADDVQVGPSDAIDRLDRFEQAEGSGFDARSLRNQDLDAGAVASVRRVRERLLRALGDPQDTVVGAQRHEEALGMSLLAGYGDRVAKRRKPGSDQLVFARGGSAAQSPASVVREAELCAVLDAREQRGRGVVAHLVTAIEPEWLLEIFPDQVDDVEDVRFDAQSGRVEALRGLRFGALMLDESRGGRPDPQRAAEVLAGAALARGLSSFVDQDALERLIRRVAHAARQSDAIVPLVDDARELALKAACVGFLSLADLTPERVLEALHAQVPAQHRGLLARLAPEQVRLPGGRPLQINYEADRPPWVASRLQDFFGLADGPRLGSEPLVLHLLAPNRRAVQVTTDLAGFWDRHYPEQRKQLMRRYPRHEWPEDPRTARPPEPRPAGPRRRKR